MRRFLACRKMPSFEVLNGFHFSETVPFATVGESYIYFFCVWGSRCWGARRLCYSDERILYACLRWLCLWLLWWRGTHSWRGRVTWCHKVRCLFGRLVGLCVFCAHLLVGLLFLNLQFVSLLLLPLLSFSFHLLIFITQVTYKGLYLHRTLPVSSVCRAIIVSGDKPGGLCFAPCRHRLVTRHSLTVLPGSVPKTFPPQERLLLSAPAVCWLMASCLSWTWNFSWEICCPRTDVVSGTGTSSCTAESNALARNIWTHVVCSMDHTTQTLRLDPPKRSNKSCRSQLASGSQKASRCFPRVYINGALVKTCPAEQPYGMPVMWLFCKEFCEIDWLAKLSSLCLFCSVERERTSRYSKLMIGGNPDFSSGLVLVHFCIFVQICEACNQMKRHERSSDFCLDSPHSLLIWGKGWGRFGALLWWCNGWSGHLELHFDSGSRELPLQ